jgi:nucleotide-binding universal stress UspA family protein
MAQEILTARLLIGTEGRPEDEAALAAICEVLDPDRVELRIVHVLTVPMTAPLEAAMPEAEKHAAHLLRRAQEITARFGLHVETAILRGREVGGSLVEEARRVRASAVLVRFRSRPAPMGHYLVSMTVSTLLNTCPCPVITVHLPHS